MKVPIKSRNLPGRDMTIINATPHSVAIYGAEGVEYNDKQRKYFIVDGASPIHNIHPSGILLSARMQTDSHEPLHGIPMQRNIVLSADPLPEGDDFYIVSRLYHGAMTALGEPTGRLLLIGSPVYRVINGATAPVGCLALERG